MKSPEFLSGVCHRWEQSALSVVLARLFREKYYHFAVDVNWFLSVQRGDRVRYFEQLERGLEHTANVTEG